MKLLTICVLLMTAIPLHADSTADWMTAAHQAQAFLNQSKFAAAAASAEQALRIAKRFDPMDARLSATYFLLGAIHREAGHCAESRPNFVHAIGIWTRQPEGNAHYIFNSITGLISLFSECDDFAAAEKTFRTYADELQRCRSTAMDDAKLLSLRAVIARGRKKYGEAEALFRQSISALEHSPEASPVEIVVERGNLAVALDKQKRYPESLVESQRTIEILEQLAPRHPSLVAALNNAGCSLAAMGRRDEAERVFQRALTTASDLYGEDNRIVAKIMLSYARVLRENKETPAAADWQRRGVELYRRALIRDNGTVDMEELRSVKR